MKPGPDPAEILQHVMDAFPQISSEMAALAGLLPVCSRCGPGATHVADALAYLESHTDLPLPFWRCRSCAAADDQGDG